MQTFYLETEDPPQIYKDVQEWRLQWKLLGMKAERITEWTKKEMLKGLNIIS